MAAQKTYFNPEDHDPKELTTINLRHEITVNGISFPAGPKVTVPKIQAEDIQRIDNDHQDYKDNLQKKRKFEVNSGTMAVGSGAE